MPYIAAPPKINSVLLTDGDPLVLSANRLDKILGALRALELVTIIRTGSKLVASEPMRITEVRKLLEVLACHSRPDARVYVVAHFNQPRELTPGALAWITALQGAGVILVDQTPLLRGVNDDPRRPQSRERRYFMPDSASLPPPAAAPACPVSAVRTLRYAPLVCVLSRIWRKGQPVLVGIPIKALPLGTGGGAFT